MDLLKAPAVIGRLAGLLAEKTPPQILIDCQGVGYEVWVPMSSFYQLPALGERVTLLTHFVVREDAQLLYGFVTETERAAFRELIRISGIGPRMALAVLSGMSVAELAQAIAAQQAGRLTKVPGIGRKTAERLLLELKGRLGPDLGAPGAAAPASDSQTDILQALLALGYSDKEAAAALQALPPDVGVSEGIRLALKALAKYSRRMSIHTDDFALPPGAAAPRLVSGAAASTREEALERALRPKLLDEYVGQAKAREQLEIFIGAARKRGEALDHVLLFGPPGLGKTTLSHIIAHELGVQLRQTSGPVLEKPKDLAAILTSLEKNDVLFIDEIHRLSPVVEEILYPALEDYQIDILIGEGPAARSIKLDVQPFTLVGATTRAGMLTNPLRDRFGIVARLEFYTAEELARIVRRSAGLLQVEADAEGAFEIARRSRGTPRIANRLLRRVRDYADVKGQGRITQDIAHAALALLDVDPEGFDVMDRKLLEAVIQRFDGGPVGLDNIAASIGEEPGTIEDVIEPYLIQQGYLQRTPRGRVATLAAWRHLGLTPPQGAGGLF